MSRSPRFAHILQGLLLSVVPLSACGLDCEEGVDKERILVSQDTTRFQELIDQCLEDDKDCGALCKAVYDELHGEWGYYDECKATALATDIQLDYASYWEYCDDGVVEGRRPPGLSKSIGHASSEAGHRLASMARLEEASIHAFLWLAMELEHHGAPEALVRGARQAALDEIVHTRLSWEMARAYGAVPPRAVVDLPQAPRTLEALAIENVMEGCVRETYGALVALHQSLCASDPVVRCNMKIIAADEAEHAELGWAIDAWVRQERPDLAGQLDRTRQRAVEALVCDSSFSDDPTAIEMLGMPSQKTQRELIASARGALWSDAA